METKTLALVTGFLLILLVASVGAYTLGRNSVEPIIQRETIEVPVEIIKEVPVPGPERIIEREVIVEVPVQEEIEEPPPDPIPGRPLLGDFLQENLTKSVYLLIERANHGPSFPVFFGVNEFEIQIDVQEEIITSSPLIISMMEAADDILLSPGFCSRPKPLGLQDEPRFELFFDPSSCRARHYAQLQVPPEDFELYRSIFNMSHFNFERVYRDVVHRSVFSYENKTYYAALLTVWAEQNVTVTLRHALPSDQPESMPERGPLTEEVLGTILILQEALEQIEEEPVPFTVGDEFINLFFVTPFTRHSELGPWGSAFVEFVDGEMQMRRHFTIWFSFNDVEYVLEMDTIWVLEG